MIKNIHIKEEVLHTEYMTSLSDEDDTINLENVISLIKETYPKLEIDTEKVKQWLFLIQRLKDRDPPILKLWNHTGPASESIIAYLEYEVE